MELKNVVSGTFESPEVGNALISVEVRRQGMQVLRFPIRSGGESVRGGPIPAQADGKKVMAGDMTKVKALCESTFDESVCTKLKGHHGKHFDNREGRWEAWTDQGKARILAERAQAQAANEAK
jgi:hypothetical protein